MRAKTSLIINEGLIARAKEATGIRDISALVAAGLSALIARESSRRLAAIGGTDPKLRPIRRRRSDPE